MEKRTGVIEVTAADWVPDGEIWFFGPHEITILKGLKDSSWPWNTLGLCRSDSKFESEEEK